jgi:hypothetical protein
MMELMNWHHDAKLPSVIIKYVALLFPIRDIPSSNLDPETDSPEFSFRVLPQPLQANAGTAPQIAESFCDYSEQRSNFLLAFASL